MSTGVLHRPYVIRRGRPTPRRAGGELVATTAAGARLVAMAERLARLDATGTLTSLGRVERLADAGYLAAPIPAQFGGMGVASTADVFVAHSRLARADVPAAIDAGAHLAAVTALVRRWEIALASGRGRDAEALGRMLEAIALDPAPRGHGTAGTVPEPSAATIGSLDPATRGHGTAGTVPQPSAAIIGSRDPATRGHGTAGTVPQPSAAITDRRDPATRGRGTAGTVPEPGSAVTGVRDPLLDRDLVATAYLAATSLGIAESSDCYGIARPLFDIARLAVARAGVVIDGFRAAHPRADAPADAAAWVTAAVASARASLAGTAVHAVELAARLGGPAVHPIPA